MGYIAGLIIFLTLVTTIPWYLWQSYKKLAILESRISWLQTKMRQAGIRLDNDDYIRYCLLTGNFNLAVSEYQRIHRVDSREARQILAEMESNLRK